MQDQLLIFIAAAFLLAGFVKGVIGLGLPTVSMGLLAVNMAPGQAIAIVIVPAIVTNIWQTFVGPYLRDIVRRLWPLMLGTVIGIWLNAGLLTGPYAPYATVILGVLLVINAIMGLTKLQFSVMPRNEKWIGGIVGLITGAVSAGTGVQVFPSMPYMQAIGMEKDELVQALGVYFTVATVALAFNVTASGLLSAATALPGAVAMAASFAGMFVGQAVRSRMDPVTFRRWFLIAMILLGCYIGGNALIRIHG
ncbi:MAG: sulfite exporter TauE/SafE family protein [Bradyrhizobium sp.]